MQRHTKRLTSRHKHHPRCRIAHQQAQDHVNAAAGGSFLSLDIARAKTLIDKIASNQSWKGERQPARPRGVHQIDTVDMLAAKLELLMKKLESPHQEVNQVSESRMTCETCGETGHSGKVSSAFSRTS